MSTQRQQWLLKVIAGPHQGAEMGVRAGKMLIGSDDECDVVLHDVLIAPQHVEIEATANGITAAPLGGRVYINGKRIRDARQPVPDFAFVSIGGSHLVIGPDNGRWPLLSAADVPELEKEVEAAPAEEKKAEEPVATQEEPKVVTPAAAPVSQPPRGMPLFGIAAGILILLVWFIAYQDFFGLGPDEPAKSSASSKPLDRAKAVVEEMGLMDTIKIEETAGRVSISGYVDTEAKQRELQAAFREAVPGLHTRIYSLEKIASSARSLLDDQRMPLTVSSLSEGKLKISGKLTSADPWVRMKQILMRSVPGIGGIEDSVEIEAPRPVVSQRPIATPVPIFVQVPAAAPPSAPVAAAPVGSAPSPQSASPPAREPLPPEPDPVTDYLVTADTIDTPEATIATIRFIPEALSFVRLSTGGVYFVGARLPFGGKITKIDASSVTIDEKGTSRTVLPGDLVVMPRGTKSATTSANPK